MVLVLVGSVLTLTTPPIALTDGLAWLGRPLRRLHVPTDELALMVTIALRFIPTLLVELETIMRAQRARGAEFGSGGLRARARGAGACARAAVRAQLPPRRRARVGHGGALLPAGGRAHAAVPAARAGRRTSLLLVVTAAVIAAGLLLYGAWMRDRVRHAGRRCQTTGRRGA